MPYLLDCVDRKNVPIANLPFSLNASLTKWVAFGSEELQNERTASFDKKARRKRYVACDELVRLTGLEPVRPEDTSTSSLPVYQFQHSRI